MTFGAYLIYISQIRHNMFLFKIPVYHQNIDLGRFIQLLLKQVHNAYNASEHCQFCCFKVLTLIVYSMQPMIINKIVLV